jgi:peptide/nickel transport system substrate-binding protein
MRTLVFLFTAALCATAYAEPRHGVAMHGEPKHDAQFSTVDYVKRNAPKGGGVTFGVQGSFDSLNPFIIKGAVASGVREYVFESLMARSQDEAFSLYGLLAESIDTPADRSSATFILRPEARFSDGRSVTTDDVIFSHAVLRDKGRPNHRDYYSKVSAVEKVGERGVKFTFKSAGDREMPLIMGLMPVLPSHLFSAETFEATTLSSLVGSGPYVFDKIEPGKSVVYKRNPDYWGRDLPINRGLYNFDEIRYEYYRDASSMFEAFKRGLIDISAEQDPGRWATAYDFPAVKDGRVALKTFATGAPAGLSGLVFNTRRSVFADIRVRQALALLFDADWINKNLFHGLYARTDSYFARSELSSTGRAADARERTLLGAFPGAVSADILEGKTAPPPAEARAALRQALALFRQAGYETKDGLLRNAATGEPLSFEMLAATREQERLFLTYKNALERAGVTVVIRQVDSAQMQRRRQQFDFDMIQNSWGASLSPGNEQSFRWSKVAADQEGSFNYAGVKNDAVDAMIAAVLAATSREDFVSAVRALDRVLLSGRYVIPLFHLQEQWVAHWTHLRHPEKPSLYGYRVDTWWRENAPQ